MEARATQERLREAWREWRIEEDRAAEERRIADEAASAAAIAVVERIAAEFDQLTAEEVRFVSVPLTKEARARLKHQYEEIAGLRDRADDELAPHGELPIARELLGGLLQASAAYRDAYYLMRSDLSPRNRERAQLLLERGSSSVAEAQYDAKRLRLRAAAGARTVEKTVPTLAHLVDIVEALDRLEHQIAADPTFREDRSLNASLRASHELLGLQLQRLYTGFAQGPGQAYNHPDG